MSEIAIVGEKDIVWGFKALGISIYIADKKEEALTILNNLINQNVSLIFLTETLAKEIGDSLEQMSKRKTPIISLIPNPKERLYLAEETIRKRVKKAVGIDIY